MPTNKTTLHPSNKKFKTIIIGQNMAINLEPWQAKKGPKMNSVK